MKQRREETLKLINYISETKNIDKNIIISFLKNSIQRIINSELDPDALISLEVQDNELVLSNLNKLIIADEEEYSGESKIVDIHLSEAQKIDPNAKIGETIKAPISFDDFSRTMYSKIEQSFKIEIIKWEKKRIYEKYQPLIGQVVEARLEEDFGGKGATFILEDGTLCYMPSKYQNNTINLSDKKYHNVTIEEVYEDSKSYQVLVSNDSPNKVREILKNEIPEIERGEIQIVGLSRIKGERSKISFRKNPNYEGEINVIGAITGANGSRINKVCEIFGEKIDVVLYSENINEYIANALSPAKVISINKKPSTNDYLVVVPNRHNTLAIGKKGSNVKLTVELIRVNIDICSYSYALEHNIPINWNGNISAEELTKLDSEPQAHNNERRNQYYNGNSVNRNRSRNNFNVSIEDFEKDIAEYNSEILSYQPVDYSNFNIDLKDKKEEKNLETNQELFDNDFTKNDEIKINKNEIKKVNENFKFDKDIAGDIDLDDYDFSDFEDDF